jgi:hypothetical protein
METIERDKDGWPVLKAGMRLRTATVSARIITTGDNREWRLLRDHDWSVASGSDYIGAAAITAWARGYVKAFATVDGAETWHPYTQVQPKPLAPERVWVNVYTSSTCSHLTKDEAESDANRCGSLLFVAKEYVPADAVQGCIDYVRAVAAGRWMSTDAARAAVATLPK